MPTQPMRIRMNTLLGTRDGIPSNKDARLTNVLVEQNGNELDVLKRPGFTSYASPATGSGGGATAITDANGSQQLLACINNTLYLSQSTVSTAWTATGGTTNFGSGNVTANGLLFFNGLFWIINPGPQNVGDTGVYSSPDGITWTTVNANAAFNVSYPRIQFMSCVFQGKMWVMAGTLNSVTQKDVWNSSDGATWTQVQSNAAFGVRLGGGILVYNNLMWILGDLSGVKNDVWSSPDGITWTQATNSAAWAARADFAYFVIGGKMWLGGGGNYLQDGWTSTDGITWTAASTPGWSGRRCSQYFVYNNLAYIVNGRTASSTYTKDMWSTPDGQTWTQVTADTTIAGSGGAANASGVDIPTSWIAANGTVYVFGQMLSTGWSSTIYKGTSSVTTSTLKQVSAGGTLDWSKTLDGTQLAVKNTANAWNYTIAGQSLAQVTNSNYPPSTVRGLVYLDGTFYVMDSKGQIWGSAVNDFTTWTALNVITAQGEPDNGVCITKYVQYVVAFGQWTTEFFYDAGNSVGSPLSSMPTAMQLVGCASADSVVQAESSVFWVGQAKAHGQAFNPQRFVAQLNGLTYSVISTPNIDRILNADTMVGAWGVYCKFLGHSLYIVSLPVSKISLAYDLKSGMWYYFTTGTAQSAQSISAGNMTYTTQVDGTALVSVTLTAHGFGDGDPITIAGATQTAYNGTWNITYVDANTFTFVPTSVPAATPATGSPTAAGTTQGVFPLLQAFNYGGLQLFQNYADGKIYQISDTTYTDNGVFIDTKGRFERLDTSQAIGMQGLLRDGNSQMKFCGWTDLVTDKASTHMLLRWSDDDYQTYSHYRSADLSLKRSRISRCGAFLRRGFEIRHTDTVATRFQGLDLGIEQGAE